MTTDRTAEQLSARKAAILRAVVEDYIASSQPVGSGQVVAKSELSVSSATVRSEMVALEETGYLRQPHTSAGRVPTEKGYRYFVDTLMEPYQLARSESMQVKTFFESVHGELERLLRETSGFVSDLTEYAAVVLGPEASSPEIRSAQFVRLHEDSALCITVYSTGAIDKRQLTVPAELTDDDLQVASKVLTERLRSGVAVTGSPLIDQVVDRAIDLLSRPIADDEVPVFIGGTAAVARLFDAVEKVRDVLEVLEKQFVITTLLRDLVDRGMEVAIGSETGIEPLAECSVIVAPYDIDGRQAGSIAVVGPTRMNYAQTLAAVARVSERLSQRLTEG